MRNYLFLILVLLHLLVGCSKEMPGHRVDPNSALGRRESMEQRMEEKLNKDEIYPTTYEEQKDPRKDSNKKHAKEAL